MIVKHFIIIPKVRIFGLDIFIATLLELLFYHGKEIPPTKKQQQQIKIESLPFLDLVVLLFFFWFVGCLFVNNNSEWQKKNKNKRSNKILKIYNLIYIFYIYFIYISIYCRIIPKPHTKNYIAMCCVPFEI